MRPYGRHHARARQSPVDWADAVSRRQDPGVLLSYAGGPPGFWLGMSVMGRLGAGLGEGVGQCRNPVGGNVGDRVGWRAVFPASVAAAGCAVAEQVAHGHHVIAVGDQYGKKLIHQVDCAGVGVVQ